MKVTRLLFLCGVVVVACLAHIQNASAARIYNFLVVPVTVTGFPNESAILQPGQRSDSLGWSSATNVPITMPVTSFFGPSIRLLCYFDWGLHAEIQGGNYIVIAQLGRDVRCNLCNANHELVGRSEGRVPEDVREYTSPYLEC
jgi:hypothetical protein